MSLRHLLGELAREGLVEPALLDETTPQGQAAANVLAGTSRDALRTQQAGASVSVWFGALMLAWFLVAIEATESVPFGVLLGAASLGLAAVLSRAPATLIGLQVRWIATIFGQVLIFASMAEVVGDDEGLCVVGLVLQAITLAAVRDLAIGCAAVVGGVTSLLVLAAELHVGPFGHGLIALSLGTCTALLWAREASLAVRLGRLWQPLAYALPVVLWAPLVTGLFARGSATDLQVLSLGWAALSGWLVFQAGRERPELQGRPQWLAWAALLLTAIVGADAPGIGAGLAILLLGQLRSSVGLQVIGLSAIGGFLFFWYYELGTSLLNKSLTAVGNGAVFLLAAALLRRGAWRPREVEARPLAARITDLRWLALALGLGLAIPGYVIASKEAVLASGETVLLRLAPVDPRSLMQGDYMVLRYAIIRDIPNIDALAPHGNLIITRDPNNVAEFVRVDDGRPLGTGELRLRYVKRGRGEVSLGAESFLFPEGEGPLLDAARYGELALAPAGDSVLIGLRDEARRPLGTRLHDSR